MGWKVEEMHEDLKGYFGLKECYYGKKETYYAHLTLCYLLFLIFWSYKNVYSEVKTIEQIWWDYCMNYDKIRNVIDSITAKTVLILGRFTEERKCVLDSLRENLRCRGYVPILFDFDKPASKDVTGTVETLARMVRFIIADLTDPSSILVQ